MYIILLSLLILFCCPQDLVDDPKPRAKRDDAANFKFANRSSAPPVVTHTPPAVAEKMGITRLGTTPTHDQVIANLSNLKKSFPSEPVAQDKNSGGSTAPICDENTCVLPGGNVNGVNGDTVDATDVATELCNVVGGQLEFRDRCDNKHYKSQGISLARMKAVSIRSGNMDWNCFQERDTPKNE